MRKLGTVSLIVKLSFRYENIHLIVLCTLCLAIHLPQNPDYMKDGFHITIETIHVENDLGEQPNVSCVCTPVRTSLIIELRWPPGYISNLFSCRSITYQRPSWISEMLSISTSSMMQSQAVWVCALFAYTVLFSLNLLCVVRITKKCGTPDYSNPKRLVGVCWSLIGRPNQNLLCVAIS